MALQKSKTAPSGAVGDYWVVETHNNKQTNATMLVVMLFVSQATRTAGNAPLLRQNIGTMPGTYLAGDAVYAWAKRSILVKGVETNFFIDAVDC